jgi:hypothetical protein
VWYNDVGADHISITGSYIMKIIGVGLNRTGTKTLRACLQYFGYKHKTYDVDSFNQYLKGDYDSLMRTVNKYDSFEDWPWPLIFREIEKNFSDCKFILTKRRNPDLWFNSLCRHAIYGGPLTRFEKYIYGYPIPHGHKAEHIKIYNEHNKSVEDYFKNKSGKLLTVCWENGDGWEEISAFLGNEAPDIPFPHYNRTIHISQFVPITRAAYFKQIFYPY